MPRTAASVAKVLADLARVLGRLRVRWYVFGAQALVLRGMPRATADLDVTVLLGDRSTKILSDALEAGGFSLRIPDPSFVATTRVLPIVHTASRFPIDIVLGGPGLEERFADAAEAVRIGRVDVPVAAPIDLVLMKVLAGRPKDLEDATSLMRAHPSLLDDADLDATAAELAAALGEDELLRNLESVRARSKGRTPKPKRAPAARKRAPR